MADEFTSGSGAKRSSLLPNTNRVPLGFIQLVAARGDYGDERYGRFNYRKGLLDTVFVEQFFAHAIAHLQQLANVFHDTGQFPDSDDDSLAGAAWGLMALWESREAFKELDRLNEKPLEPEDEEKFAGIKAYFENKTAPQRKRPSARRKK